MKHQVVAVTVLICLCGATVAGGLQSPTVFKKLDFFIHTGDEVDDRDAQLILDPQRRVLIFADEDRASQIFATVDWSLITGVTYENSKHARITAGLLIAWPMFFLKGRKHWLTVTFRPAGPGEVGGYVYARMDKSNYQAILAAINGYTGYEVRRVEENGEVSILYPGSQPAQARAEPQAAPSQAEALPAEALPAAPLPADSDGTITAAPLPPAAGGIQPPTLANKGVQWTDRTGGFVGFVWAAEIENPNLVEIIAAVTLSLRDTSGAVIHQAQEHVVVPPRDVAAFTADGQMEEGVALRAADWTFDVEAEEPRPGEGRNSEAAPTSSAPAEANAAAAGTSASQPTEKPVPLTAAMVPPELIFDSVQIDIQEPELQELNVSGKRISLRCLVQSDGTVSAARVLNISPPIPLKAASDALARSVERSAVMYWRFSPATEAGVPKPVWFTLTIRYEPAG